VPAALASQPAQPAAPGSGPTSAPAQSFQQFAARAFDAPARPTLPTPTELYHGVVPADARRPAEESDSPDDWPTNSFSGAPEEFLAGNEAPAQGGPAQHEVAQAQPAPASASLSSHRVWIVASTTGARVVPASAPRPQGALEAVLVANDDGELGRLLSGGN
jgi:hypothetical protein